METQKTMNSKNNLEKEERSWKNHVPWLQTILQSYSNQNSMVRHKNQTHTSTEEERKAKNKLKHLWSINLDKGGKNI